MLTRVKSKYFGGVPEEYHDNFFHLIADLFWFGVLNGTSLSFNMVYLTRIGGTTADIGLLAAAPAVVNILFTLPFGTWLSKRNSAREVVISSVLHRIFYLLWVPVPMLFANSVQIRVLVGLTFFMNIPGTILQVGFNDMFAEAVPMEWRGVVAGYRNAALAVSSVLVSFICAPVLTKVSFPLNYQIVFFLGFLGAAFSSYHLWKIWKNLEHTQPRETTQAPAQKIHFGAIVHSLLPDFGVIRKEGGKQFRIAILALFGFHLTQYLAIPLFPIYQVNVMGLTDTSLSIGNAIFFMMVFFVSTHLATLATRFGNKRLVGGGLIFMGFYPLILISGKSAILFLAASFVGGTAWGLAGGVIYNYLLENVPEKNRAPYLAIYNLILYGAILVGSLGGPAFSNWIGLTRALLVFGIARMVVGLTILRRG